MQVMAFAAVAELTTDVVTPGCAGCVAGLASEEVVAVAPRVALACDCASMAGACAFRVAAASAAGVFATSGDIATFTIWGNPLALVVAGVAVTATMLDMLAMVPDAGGMGVDMMRATLEERVSAGELLGRICGMVQIVPVGMIFLGKIMGCTTGVGGTRLLLNIALIAILDFLFFLFFSLFSLDEDVPCGRASKNEGDTLVHRGQQSIEVTANPFGGVEVTVPDCYCSPKNGCKTKNKLMTS